MCEPCVVRTRTTVWRIDRASADIYRELRSGRSVEEVAREYGVEIEEISVEGNTVLVEGANFIWRAVSGQTGLVYFNEANTYIGVGDGTAPASPSQTGLQGANRFYKKVDSGYPVVSGNRISFRATFSESEANFTWNEWTVANGGSDDAVNLNRKVENLGTKTENSIWILQIELSIT